MKPSTFILFAAGATAMPMMPNGPLAAIESRAPGAIGSILGYFRRDDGVVWKQVRTPVDDALETSTTTPRRTQFVPVSRGAKKQPVPVVGRTIVLPRNADNGGGVN